MLEHVYSLMCGTRRPGCARISHRKGIQLDAVARGALICGYCGTGEVGIALELHREIVKWNCSPNVITYAKRKTCSFVLICSGLLDCFYESLRSSISRFQFWYMELCVDDVPPIQRKVTSGKLNGMQFDESSLFDETILICLKWRHYTQEQ
ncbi:uncharacterized protein LOC113317829 [Papaver somniferum]|uniref:uncharacterized protein LOC113317829 n=1 Tax=Papaver somniferum TaxID=3469 RepID=UPI000E6FFFE9|nr:uncharacterized protein LOC113317829 [Papaver somniferum]